MLGAMGLLLWRLTGNLSASVLGVVLLGTSRSIWIHNVIAEVYSMSLAITALMFLVALWPAPWQGAWSARRRVLWLACWAGSACPITGRSLSSHPVWSWRCGRICGEIENNGVTSPRGR
jgi:hypothetical protein